MVGVGWVIFAETREKQVPINELYAFEYLNLVLGDFWFLAKNPTLGSGLGL